MIRFNSEINEKYELIMSLLSNHSELEEYSSKKHPPF